MVSTETTGMWQQEMGPGGPELTLRNLLFSFLLSDGGLSLFSVLEDLGLSFNIIFNTYFLNSITVKFMSPFLQSYEL